MSDFPPPSTPDSRPQVPTSKRFTWGIGGFAECMIYNGVNGLVDPIYNMAMGIDARIIGLARSIPRFADLMIDPLIGHFSDNTRSRWGRRRPWMLIGAVISALVTAVMWFVPGAGSHAMTNGFVCTMMVLLFTFGFSLFVIPYTGQGYEMTTDYNERTHLFKWRQYAFAVAGFLTPWLPWMCIRIDVLWGGIAPSDARGLYGIHWLGVFLGLLILATALCPIVFNREGAGAHHSDEPVSFFKGLRLTMGNRAFWPLVIGNFLLKFGMVSTGIFFMYLIIYHVAGGNRAEGTGQWGIFCNVINVATFIAMAPVVRLTDRLGKKPALLVLMALSAVTYASVWFSFQQYSSGLVPDAARWLHDISGMPLAIAKAWPVYLVAAGIGIFCNCMPLIMNSMLADVCDVDELQSGHQRQAFYGAIFVTCDKVAMGVAMLLQGFLLTSSGFNPAVNLQAPETISFWLKALLFSQPTGFVLGFLIVLTYPITRAKAHETRALLNQRKSSAAN